MTRRRLLAALAAGVAARALTAAHPALAQAAGEAFDYDILSARMQAASQSDPPAPERMAGFLADLDYDGYQMIRFRGPRSRWADGGDFRLQAFHPGWLFEEPVHLFELTDGMAQPLTFSTADFDYGGGLDAQVPQDAAMPGVAGFRLLTPLNRADAFDELVSFLGASYFRALGQGNVYGLSARGLAVDTAQNSGEEFPRFTDFWLQRPAGGTGSVIALAALESPSVAGAYRFVITPGETTVIEVTARLYPRAEVALLGIAPLTSMFLFGGADPGEFGDFRAAVHDSEYMVLNTRGGETFVRALNNPPRLATSFFGADNPVSFGLVQRSRDFGDYLDAEAHYERRPSLMVEPLGDWGDGAVALVEIPSDLEGNDNIVAFWVPETAPLPGQSLELSYRLHWGMTPPGDGAEERARVIRSRAGHGGVAGAPAETDRRKFVIDFEGGLLGNLASDADVEAEASAIRGEITQAIASRIEGTSMWRLVIEVRADSGVSVELRAALSGYGRKLTETWLYQWVTE